MFKPFKLFEPFKPFNPFKPVKPFNPLEPFERLEPFEPAQPVQALNYSTSNKRQMTDNKAKNIILDELDPKFKEEIAEKIGLEVIKPCLTCGSCTGVCPVHEVIEDFDPRLIIHMIILGMRKEVLSSDRIWFCCLCNSCFFVCPQGIKFSRVAAELRKIATEKGHADEEFLKRLEALNPYLQDLCRRTMFSKVRDGFCGSHVMPCWRKHSK